MQGSTLQAMASAVEKADIVLICYSQKYKNSDNCRAGMLQLNLACIQNRMSGFFCGYLLFALFAIDIDFSVKNVCSVIFQFDSDILIRYNAQSAKI